MVSRESVNSFGKLLNALKNTVDVMYAKAVAISYSTYPIFASSFHNCTCRNLKPSADGISGIIQVMNGSQFLVYYCILQIAPHLVPI